MIESYEKLRREFVETVGQYRRDHLGLHYEHAIELLHEVRDSADGRPPHYREQQLEFDGWLAPPSRASRALLAGMNPDYRSEVEHYARAGLGRRARLFRWGLRVRARAPLDAAPFVFRVRDTHGHPARLPWSNLLVELQHRTLETEPPDVDPRALVGFLDSIVHSPVPDERPETWLAALAHQHPAEVYDVLIAADGAPFRQEVADALRMFATNRRWADRFALSAYGLTATFQSDLRPMRVNRVMAAVENAQSVAVPALVPEGALVRSRPTTATFPIPDHGWLTLRDVEVQDGGTVFRGNDLLSYEGSADPVHDFVAGQWRTVFGSRTRPEGALFLPHPLQVLPISEGILLAGRSDDNWFHWIVEYLPRILTLPGDIAADVPVLISARTPATGIEALRELTDRPVVAIDPDRRQPVEILHVAGPPVQILDTTNVPWVDGLKIDRHPLDLLRQRWGIEALPPASRLIYLERRSRHRGITNEAALARIAHRRGFDVIDPSGYSFREQRELFGSAAVVVGGSGAVMSNYLFMPPRSRIVALTSEQLADFVVPAALAEIAGCDFRYVLGRSEVTLARSPDRNHWIHADFRVDPREFAAALDDVLTEPSSPDLGADRD